MGMDFTMVTPTFSIFRQSMDPRLVISLWEIWLEPSMASEVLTTMRVLVVPPPLILSFPPTRCGRTSTTPVSPVSSPPVLQITPAVQVASETALRDRCPPPSQTRPPVHPMGTQAAIPHRPRLTTSWKVSMETLACSRHQWMGPRVFPTPRSSWKWGWPPASRLPSPHRPWRNPPGASPFLCRYPW